MVKKLFLALAVVGAISVYLTIREEGVENAYGGIFAPFETVRDGSLAESKKENFGMVGPTTMDNFAAGTSTQSYKQMTEGIKDRVNAAMERSVKRSSR